jgi:hypothetical protein
MMEWICAVAGKRTWIAGLACLMAFAIASEPAGSVARAADIDGIYKLSLPMPGGEKESILSLASTGGSLSGTMSAPGAPSEIYPIQDGSCGGEKFRFSVEMDRTTYTLEGTYNDGGLAFDMTTEETIPLGDGERLAGKTGEITGSYQVPVYSPGGIKENRFDLVAEGGKITGEMYALGGDDSAGGMAGAPDRMPLPRTDEATPPAGMVSNGKQDLNRFQEGRYDGNRIDLSTETAQGSVFHFSGNIEGDIIRLTLNVTDRRNGLTAEAL